jgi:diguanylate cyclase (GGDEF)-like protein
VERQVRKVVAPYDPGSSEPMAAIVRVAIVLVTLALFFASSFNALVGQRDIAIILALATPLGLSAWGFGRAGHTEAAIVLLCTVLVTVVTLILFLNPMGVHDMAVTAYGGVALMSALLLPRRSFLAIVGLTLFAATTVFVVELLGYSHSQIAYASGWPQYVEFVVIAASFAILGRTAAEALFGSLGDAHHASSEDATTGTLNRSGFMMGAAMSLKALHVDAGTAVLVVVDIDGFRRMNIVVGHQAADGILAEVARRLASTVGAGEHLIGRIGDDEFAVLGLGITEDASEAFARSIQECTNFDFQGVSIRSASGYSRFPRDAHGIESLMLGAQSAVASAKGRTSDRLSSPADRI